MLLLFFIIKMIRVKLCKIFLKTDEHKVFLDILVLN